MSANPEPRRGSWYLLTGLLLGLGLGLLVAWVLAPVKYTDTAPASLRADFKDQYRNLIASSYLATGDLGRAQSRLALLGDSDPRQALIVQAQSILAAGNPDGNPYVLVNLANALEQRPITVLSPTISPTAEQFSSQTPSLLGGPSITPTRRATSERTPILSPTPRPTRTPTPTLGAAFALASQQNVCDPNLVEGLLQIEVRDASGQPIPGVVIIITWQDSEEYIFTGFKPEIGDGYADFVMNPNVEYTVQLASGSQMVVNLGATSCQTEAGESYRGGIRLVFQQP
jgi:hypothetical protein